MFGALGAGQVSADFNSRQRGLISAARIFSTFDGPTDAGSGKEDEGEVVSIKGDIKFQSTEFSYPARPDFPIFYKSPEYDGVNLSVDQKESIGLVGRSGYVILFVLEYTSDCFSSAHTPFYAIQFWQVHRIADCDALL